MCLYERNLKKLIWEFLFDTPVDAWNSGFPAKTELPLSMSSCTLYLAFYRCVFVVCGINKHIICSCFRGLVSKYFSGGIICFPSALHFFTFPPTFGWEIPFPPATQLSPLLLFWMLIEMWLCEYTTPTAWECSSIALLGNKMLNTIYYQRVSFHKHFVFQKVPSERW